MKAASYLMTLFVLLLSACSGEEAHEHGHEHAAGGLEPLAYTVYSDKTELFVEFKPLVVGEKSNFAAHFTVLGEAFLPLTEGKVTVSLIVGENGIRSSADEASSPGIFRLAVIPKTSGLGKLVFDIETKAYTDRIVIEGIMVYPDNQTASDSDTEDTGEAEIIYLKEQAWKVEFANAPLEKQVFNNIIQTSGMVLPAPGDEVMVSANAGGIVLFNGNYTIAGSAVDAGTHLFTISGAEIAEGNIEVVYKEAKANYEKSKVEFERVSELIKDNIVSQKEFQQAKVSFENAQSVYEALAKNYSSKGQRISSPMKGFVKNILVSEGQYVETGTPLALISKNQKLILQANVSQRYFSKLPSITSANFKTIASEAVYDTKDLNGKLVSYGKSASLNSPFIPLTFEIDNIGNIIPGSVVEVWLKSAPIPDALLIPVSSLMEEQGSFYIYVQSGGESFQKRELKLGAVDGVNAQVLAGVSEGERVVTKGAYQIKLSSVSGELPAHGHEH